VGTAAAQKIHGAAQLPACLGMGVLSLTPLLSFRDSIGRQAVGRWKRPYLSSRETFVAWKSTSLSFKIIIIMQMYKNDMLFIFVFLFCFYFLF